MKMNEEAKGCLRDAIEIVVVTGLGLLLILGFIFGLSSLMKLFLTTVSVNNVSGSETQEIELAEGVGKVPEAVLYLGFVCADEENTAPAYEEYTEGDGPAPIWYKPYEPMAVEWEDLQLTCNQLATETDESCKFNIDWFEESDNCSDNEIAEEVIRKDGGCPDYNYETTIWGWNGHSMERWEMDMLSRIFYLEFWQPNEVLCEAGCDAILQLWDLNGGTLYETLSHVNENGSYSFSTYPGMWDETYDPDGLEWCREYCEQRFYQGPEWTAQYFRKGQYHDWGEWSPIPAYEIDGIYFSYKEG